MTSTTSLSFFQKLEQRINDIDSHLCVGLDPHMKELFPEIKNDIHALVLKTEEERCDAAFTFCKNIIDSTGMYGYTGIIIIHNNNYNIMFE